ncbi:MAG: ribosome assembly RNA-binding protein YhbY [Pseudomonadales bacterium]
MTENKIVKLSSERKRAMRQIGHQLKPVVTIGDNGLSESVLVELDRALEDHELIKVKLRVDDTRLIREAVLAHCNATLVQAVGNVVLVYRAAKEPDPKLSNLLRFQLTGKR